jgi:AcrR family transcriptional regulator
MSEVTRERNRRGEGGKLRGDILAAATQLLEQAGTEEAVTLRAVARQVGISAPSIYAHFADRDAIVDAIVDAAFDDFNTAIYAAIGGVADPLARLRAGCAAYLQFAADRPNRYQLLFDRQEVPGEVAAPVSPVRTESFEWLVASVADCVAAGLSASTDPQLDSTAIWTALHGLATLQSNLPGFPWPPRDAVLSRIILGLAAITSA